MRYATALLIALAAQRCGALGPWAGKLITGDEDTRRIWAVDTNGVAESFDLDIHPEDFDLIPHDQDLYCVLYNGADSKLLKLPKQLLAGYEGGLLVTQAGESGAPSALFIVQWDGTQFMTRTIPLPDAFAPGHFEQVTFAPITLPDL